MTTYSRPHRRPHGSLDDGRKIGLWFESSADDRLQQLADAAKTSKSAMAQWLVEQVDVDQSGKPLGWDRDHPKTQEALPIDKSA